MEGYPPRLAKKNKKKKRTGPRAAAARSQVMKDADLQASAVLFFIEQLPVDQDRISPAELLAQLPEGATASEVARALDRLVDEGMVSLDADGFVRLDVLRALRAQECQCTLGEQLLAERIGFDRDDAHPARAIYAAPELDAEPKVREAFAADFPDSAAFLAKDLPLSRLRRQRGQHFVCIACGAASWVSDPEVDSLTEIDARGTRVYRLPAADG
jgi:hypothetical protein